jgi:hypothetical protein
MSNLPEIEAAIEMLPDPQIDELARWLEALRERRLTPLGLESWLDRARGAARDDATTAGMIALTRGEA